MAACNCGMCQWGNGLCGTYYSFSLGGGGGFFSPSNWPEWASKNTQTAVGIRANHIGVMNNYRMLNSMREEVAAMANRFGALEARLERKETDCKPGPKSEDWEQWMEKQKLKKYIEVFEKMDIAELDEIKELPYKEWLEVEKRMTPVAFRRLRNRLGLNPELNDASATEKPAAGAPSAAAKQQTVDEDGKEEQDTEVKDNAEHRTNTREAVNDVSFSSQSGAQTGGDGPI